MSKINTVELKSLLAKHAAAQAELQRLQELETKLQADHARALAEGDPERQADVAKAAGLASQLAMLPATIAKAEARAADADKAIEAEARIVAQILEAQRITEHRVLVEAAAAALRPFYGGQYMPPEFIAALPAVKSAATRQALAGHWAANPGHCSGSELAVAVLAGVGA